MTNFEGKPIIFCWTTSGEVEQRDERLIYAKIPKENGDTTLVICKKVRYYERVDIFGIKNLNIKAGESHFFNHGT